MYCGESDSVENKSRAVVQASLASTITASNSASTATTTSTSASASSAPDGEMIGLSLDNPFNMALKGNMGLSHSGEQAFLEDNSQRDLSPRESSNPLGDLLPEFHGIYPLWIMLLDKILLDNNPRSFQTEVKISLDNNPESFQMEVQILLDKCHRSFQMEVQILLDKCHR